MRRLQKRSGHTSGNIRKRILIIISTITAVFLLLPFLSNSQNTPSSSLTLGTTTGTTYYVAKNGRDTNPGTEPAPFLTITRGVSTLAPGDTLLVKDGVYEEALDCSTNDNCLPSGESGKPVTIKSFNKHGAIIKPKSGQMGITLGRDRRKPYLAPNIGTPHQFVTIDGFVIDGSGLTSSTIRISGSPDNASFPDYRHQPSHIRILNNEIRNAGGAVNIADLDFSVDGGENGQTPYKFWAAGISSSRANNSEFSFNTIHHNGVTDYDHGIYHFGRNGVIEGNVVYANKGSGIKAGWSSLSENLVVRNNTIYDNNTARTFKGKNNSTPGKKGQGRGISTHISKNTLIYNNIIWGGHVAGIDVIYDADGARVFNNTVYVTGSNGTSAGIRVGSGASIPQPDIQDTVVQNNIVYQQSIVSNPIYNNAIEIGARAEGVILDHNLTFGNNPAVKISEGAKNVTAGSNIQADPLFVNLGSHDFHLSSNSPARDAGVTIAAVGQDFSGLRRPHGSAYDLGAHEFSAGEAGTTNTPTPTSASSTSTPTPTPSPTLSGTVTYPAWFAGLPTNLRNFMELLYLWVFYFKRPSNMQHLLIEDTPTATPTL